MLPEHKIRILESFLKDSFDTKDWSNGFFHFQQ